MISLPPMNRPIRLVGLTGSIGTGKSTASDFFRRLGVGVVDADQLARAVVEPGRPALAEIAAAFGPRVLDREGRLDRARLAAEVFGDGEKLRLLEGILHPRIAGEAKAEMERLLAVAPHGFVVYDVPLLFEKDMADRFDLVVTVYADREASLERVAKRSELTHDEIGERLAAQLDVARKAGMSDLVLDNSTTPEALWDQVRELVGALAAHNAEKGLTNPHPG